MSNIDRLIEAIKATANDARQAQLRWAVCDSVDWDKKTIVAVGQSDELPYYDVMLGTGSVYLKPAKGALCLIGILEGDEAASFLISASEVELVEFNGGGNLGMVKVKELTDRLNAIETRFNSLLNDYKKHNHTHPQGATTGMLAPPTIEALIETQIYNIENKVITQ